MDWQTKSAAFELRVMAAALCEGRRFYASDDSLVRHYLGLVMPPPERQRVGRETKVLMCCLAASMLEQSGEGSVE